MKIGIDARFLTHPQVGGFKTYTKNLIAALAEVDTNNEYFLYLDRPPCQETKLPKQPNFTSRTVSGQLPVIGMPWREQVGITRQARLNQLDVFHAPSLTAPLGSTCPLVVTIHDVIWLFPEKFAKNGPQSWQRKLMEYYFRWVPRMAVRRAAIIVTVSQAAKDSIIQYLGIPADQIYVTHEAASQIYRQVDDEKKLAEIRQKYDLPAEYILAIGSADPRKNLTTLVQAYSLLPAAVKARYKLAIVWTHHLLAANLAKQVDELNLTDHVQFLRQVSNEDLVMLYNAASLFVFPSLYEGFGLPPLEAMACGTPVIAANNSSIPEIVGDAALLVQAEDVEAMTETMSQVLENETLQRRLSQDGLKRAANFSWEKCARETVAIYQQLEH